ncbi:MAG: sigma-70 family RNA polymerase sigma factor [Alphaproteobacteria bacterium]|jgi:RNA polymerase sigma-70 factor (ECF subfamily)|nr:sigma-70 family RNA polymerase sigma factor [Alphaproteobacteria bacterium]MDP6515977.1 sigma-70 family RNA polymerase sigma factor [Alphaproteobacteria bacterium]
MSRDGGAETGDSGAETATLDALIRNLRPQLLRYCARIAGSVIDGEDIVQDTLIKAYDAGKGGAGVTNWRSWLFRVAHNQSIDHLRRMGRHHGERLEDETPIAETDSPLETREMTRIALSLFLRLSPLQRSAVFLKDVMGYSLTEIDEIHGASLSAVKAALHRGRASLRALSGADITEPPAALQAREAGLLAEYVERFNAHDFDAVRAMLAADVELDLVGRVRKQGAAKVGQYFTNYSRIDDWRFGEGSLEGRPAILVHDPGEPSAPATYFVLIEWRRAQVRKIRDYRYARHVMVAAQEIGR